MITSCLLALCCLHGNPNTISIPDHFRRALVVFQDITGDGINDVWVETDSGHLWVHDPTEGTKQAITIPVPPNAFHIWPEKREGRWCVKGFADGLCYTCHDGTTWLLDWDLGAEMLIRPGMPPLHVGSDFLTPSYQGTLIFQSRCALHLWPTPPATRAGRRWLEITYPVPRTRDINRDGFPDLITAPIAFPAKNQIKIYFAIRGTQDWTFGQMSSQFPTRFSVKSHAWGDLNRDGYADLAVLAFPKENFSLFEELSLLVYLGAGPNRLEPHPHQTLTTQQNLWQDGPITIEVSEIRLFYYKGLIRSKFRIDRYSWDSAGFLNPNPQSQSWKMHHANRSIIQIGHDLTGDHVPDLLLSDQTGLCLVPGTASPSGPPDYDPNHMRTIHTDSTASIDISVTMGSEENDIDVSSGAVGVGRWYGGNAAILEPETADQPARVWLFFEDSDGFWNLRPIPMDAQ